MLDKQDIEILKELMQTELRPMRNDINGLKADIKGIKSDVNGLRTDVEGLKSDVEELKSDTQLLKVGQDKHSLLLEELKVSVNTIIEGQQAHAEQNNHQFTD